MDNNFEHYITKNIRAYYGKRIWAPLLYLIIMVAAWFMFSLSSVLNPESMPQNADLDYFYKNQSHFVQADFSDLTFTGYIEKAFGKTSGYYYYTKWGDAAIIVLLSPDTCEEGLPEIESIHVRGKLVLDEEAYGALLKKLSKDLNWTEDGIVSEMPEYYFSEPANRSLFTSVMFFLYFATSIFAILNILIYLIHWIFPTTAPACQNLVVFGNPRRQFRQAEEELATLPQLATEDMFITEHYFIMTSPDANAIVPIDQILWIYKHSTLHKFLWYHFSISYTMHITAKKHLYIHCPKNIKSDIDGIMDYLQEANHDIVVGFSEANRVKVQGENAKPFHVEKLVAFLRKKI